MMQNELRNNVTFQNTDYSFGDHWKTRNYGRFIKFIEQLLTKNNLKLYRGKQDEFYDTYELEENHQLAFNFKTNQVYQTKVLPARMENVEFWYFDLNTLDETSFQINQNYRFKYGEVIGTTPDEQNQEVKYVYDGARPITLIINHDWKDKDLFYQYLKTQANDYQNDDQYEIVKFSNWLKLNQTKSKSIKKSMTL